MRRDGSAGAGLLSTGGGSPGPALSIPPSEGETEPPGMKVLLYPGDGRGDEELPSALVARLVRGDTARTLLSIGVVSEYMLSSRSDRGTRKWGVVEDLRSGSSAGSVTRFTRSCGGDSLFRSLPIRWAALCSRATCRRPVTIHSSETTASRLVF